MCTENAAVRRLPRNTLHPKRDSERQTVGFMMQWNLNTVIKCEIEKGYGDRKRTKVRLFCVGFYVVVYMSLGSWIGWDRMDLWVR